MAGTEAETKKKHGSPTCSRITISYPSYAAQANPPRDGTSHSGLCPPASIIDQENVPQTSPMEEIPHLKTSFPRYVKLTTNISNHHSFYRSLT